MSLLVWNCQGLGSPWTVRVLSELIRLHNPALVFLSETKCKKRKCEYLKLKFNMFSISVESQGKGGGLMLLWSKDVNLIVHSFSSSHIDAGIANEKGTKGGDLLGSMVSRTPRRGETWLTQSSKSIFAPSLALCGDFNEILSQSEKTGGPHPQR
ncbi:UNVERIFIED_CONTAM: hypothetical protein Slati_2690600 [Sesamum latifolium]|uniref:Endonuclease/exonuclease/phosphatase domain-containing protein n=1 Tax=Sesamum latifolium TaxID=2727402 RepID=A0AAW2VWN7_9LAMI